jgi:hypothetical protein
MEQWDYMQAQIAMYIDSSQPSITGTIPNLNQSVGSVKDSKGNKVVSEEIFPGSVLTFLGELSFHLIRT